MPNESPRPIAFDKILDRLFKLMRDKAEAGDEGAKQFLKGTVKDGKLVDHLQSPDGTPDLNDRQPRSIVVRGPG